MTIQMIGNSINSYFTSPKKKRKRNKMTEASQLLTQAAAALFGDGAPTEGLARALGVDPRTLRRWLNGDAAPPPGVWADVNHLCLEAAQDASDRAAQLDAIAAMAAAR